MKPAAFRKFLKLFCSNQRNIVYLIVMKYTPIPSKVFAGKILNFDLQILHATEVLHLRIFRSIYIHLNFSYFILILAIFLLKIFLFSDICQIIKKIIGSISSSLFFKNLKMEPPVYNYFS